VSGALHNARSSASSLKNLGSFPNSDSMNCCADIGVPSGCQKGGSPYAEWCVLSRRPASRSPFSGTRKDLTTNLARFLWALARSPSAKSTGLRPGLSALAGMGVTLRAGSSGSPSHSGSLKWRYALMKS
jgi:hypothetical protein